MRYAKWGGSVCTKGKELFSIRLKEEKGKKRASKSVSGVETRGLIDWHSQTALSTETCFFRLAFVLALAITLAAGGQKSQMQKSFERIEILKQKFAHFSFRNSKPASFVLFWNVNIFLNWVRQHRWKRVYKRRSQFGFLTSLSDVIMSRFENILGIEIRHRQLDYETTPLTNKSRIPRCPVVQYSVRDSEFVKCPNANEKATKKQKKLQKTHTHAPN